MDDRELANLLSHYQRFSEIRSQLNQVGHEDPIRASDADSILDGDRIVIESESSRRGGAIGNALDRVMARSDELRKSTWGGHAGRDTAIALKREVESAVALLSGEAT